MVADADKRACRRLREIGRRAFANELVKRDRRRSEQYRKRPTIVARPRRTKKKTHPRIRSWRGYEDNAAAAA